MAPAQDLPAEAQRRYARQMVLPEVGAAGQARLRRARVLVVGVGGLGSPIALYLAAAGIGTLTLVDGDLVDLSNLQRQVLYDGAQVGLPKVAAAADRLQRLNPDVRVEALAVRLTEDNALDLVRGCDLVVDGTDNQATRYRLNDASARCGRPFVAGAVDRFAGMVGVFNHQGGPCYRCLFPEPPPADRVPVCAEAGVLGALPGLIGSLQAIEALKLILGAGESLSGQVLFVDALTNRFTTVRLTRDPSCRGCTQHPARPHRWDRPTGVPIAVTDLPAAQAGGAVLVDVREPDEWQTGTIPGAVHIPIAMLAHRAGELPGDRPVILFCRSGPRSEAGAGTLVAAGRPGVRFLAGGILAWPGPVQVPEKT